MVDGRDAYRAALAQMFKLTDTRWAPWVGIDANDEQAALIAALTAIADALHKIGVVAAHLGIDQR